MSYIAKRIASTINDPMALTWYEIRDIVDMETNRVYGPYTLDQLTDEVEDILNERVNTMVAIHAAKGVTSWDN